MLNAAPLDVNGLITDMTAMLRRLIGEDIEIVIVLALAPHLSAAFADRGQLEQVLDEPRGQRPGRDARGRHVTIETTDVELENSTFHEEAVLLGR